MMGQLVLTMTDHLLGGVTGHFLSGGIHKGGFAFGIKPIHTLTR